ncbi:MAG: LysR substrate-binding domain-containing protein [Pseudomonadota bacterium]
MRLRHIEVIQAILQAGSLGHAAELLQLPVATLSATLHEAEQQLGFMLFASVRGRLQASRETLLLQPLINRLYLELEPIRQLGDNLRQHQEPALRVVCSETLAQPLLPHCIAVLRRRFPDTPTTLSSQPCTEIVRRLLMDECDVGLSLYPSEQDGIDCLKLIQGKVQLLAPHGWLSPKQKYIALQDLAGQAMIGLQHHDPLSRLLDCKLQGLRPVPVVQIQVQSYQMLRSMVEAGEGLALVDPFTAVGAKAGGLDVCPLSPAIPVTLYALTRKGAEPGLALKTLLDIAQQKAETLLADQGLVAL